MNPKISLIIPAYNEEKYIAECLKSVSESKKEFFEIIVVDNASTDKTSEIAKSFNVKVVYEKEKGVTRARQRGFLEAEGDILAFVDADTRLPKGWLDKIKCEFKKDEKVVSVSGPYVFYDQSPLLKFIIKYLYWYALAMPMYMIVGYMAVGGNFVIKKEVLEKMGGFDTTIEFYGEDTNTARRTSKYGKIKFSPKLFIYSSSRRLKGQGLFSTTFLYTKNFLSEIIFKKPATKDYEDIR